MTIVFFVGNYGNPTDGTIMSARRFADGLKQRGHTVRIISNDVTGENMYRVEARHIPVVSTFAKKQHQVFLKFDEKIVSAALEGADVVHCYLPWKEAQKTYKLANKMNVAFTLAFHWQPEHVTYNMGLKNSKVLTKYIYKKFRKFYNSVDHVHVPTEFMKGKLLDNKYTSNIHAISNGITDTFTPKLNGYDADRDDIVNKDIFNIITIGRLSPEKNQINIIEAVALSKYKDKIQLYVCGKGPLKEKIEKCGKILPRKPIIEFLPQEELKERIYESDLFIHSSNADTEGISCIEAIACGKVPIIADSKTSAATIFSMHENSLYAANDAAELAQKIDFWIENAAVRREYEAIYASGAKEYNIDKSIEQFEDMLMLAKQDAATKAKLKKKEYKHKKKQFGVKFSLFRFLGTIFYYCVVAPLVFLIDNFYFGMRYKNRKYLKQACKSGKGAVTVCNHIHELDVIVYGLSAFPKKPIFTSQASNFKIPVAGQIINFLGAVPTPVNMADKKMFFYLLTKRLHNNKVVHMFPEGGIVRYDDELRDFYQGAFYLAKKAEVPVVPIRILYRKPKGIYKLFKKRPLLTVVYGEPLEIDKSVKESQQANDLQARTFTAMSKLCEVLPVEDRYIFESKSKAIDDKNVVEQENITERERKSKGRLK